MKALKLIVKREYLTRIKKKSFIILTILMPVFFIAFIFVPILLESIKDSETKHIVVLDSTGKYSSILKSTDYYFFEFIDNQSEDVKARVGNDVFGILQITQDLALDPEAVMLLSEKQSPNDLTQYINNSLSEKVKEDKIKEIVISDNVDPVVISNIQNILNSESNISIATIRMDKDGAEKEISSTTMAGVGILLTFLMYMFILMYGTMVMNGVVEEKSNRIVEVMISSVRPFDLMMGKIIGIGLTGLTQLSIWVVVVSCFLVVKETIFPNTTLLDIDSMLVNISMLSSINWIEILIYFIMLFIGGYLIYASIFAMFGAAVDNVQDTQQFVMPITIVFIFALYAGIYSAQNPDGPLAFWCSIIPFTSPIVMMVRIPFEIPLWEKLLSLSILYITIYFVVRFAAKIYRVGILMYGKKPSIKEIVKWFSYK